MPRGFRPELQYYGFREELDDLTSQLLDAAQESGSELRNLNLLVTCIVKNGGKLIERTPQRPITDADIAYIDLDDLMPGDRHANPPSDRQTSLHDPRTGSLDHQPPQGAAVDPGMETAPPATKVSWLDRITVNSALAWEARELAQLMRSGAVGNLRFWEYRRDQMVGRCLALFNWQPGGDRMTAMLRSSASLHSLESLRALASEDPHGRSLPTTDSEQRDHTYFTDSSQNLLASQWSFLLLYAVKVIDEIDLEIERTRSDEDRAEQILERSDRAIDVAEEVAVRRQQQAVERASDARGRFESIVTIIAAVLIAPGLVAAVYGANVFPVKYGSVEGMLLLMVSVAVLGGLGAAFASRQVIVDVAALHRRPWASLPAAVIAVGAGIAVWVVPLTRAWERWTVTGAATAAALVALTWFTLRQQTRTQP